VVDDEGEEDDDETSRLSDLIALAEVGLQAEEEDDTGRLSELIALANAGLQAEEDDDAFFTQAVTAADEADAAYYRQPANRANIDEPNHMNKVEESTLLSQVADEAEAAYYR
jgi:hypothetical protein